MRRHLLEEAGVTSENVRTMRNGIDGQDNLAAYVVTSSKYRLPEHLTDETALLAEELRRRVPDCLWVPKTSVPYR